jgi:hypothetical protein
VRAQGQRHAESNDRPYGLELRERLKRLAPEDLVRLLPGGDYNDDQP